MDPTHWTLDIANPAAVEARDLLDDDERSEVFAHLKVLVDLKDPGSCRALDVKSLEDAPGLLVLCESGGPFGTRQVRIIFTLIPERKTLVVLWFGVRPIGKGLPGRGVILSQIRLERYLMPH